MNNLDRTTAAILLAVGTFAITLAGCRVDQTQEAELPEVTVEGGQIPKYEVTTAEVEVGTREETVTVPDVEVTMPAERREEQQSPPRPQQ